MSELITKHGPDTSPPDEADNWSHDKQLSAAELERWQHIVEKMGEAALRLALSVTRKGTLEPSWNIRASSSDHASSKGDTGGRGGSVGEVGYQRDAKVNSLPVSSPINSGGKMEYKSVADIGDEREQSVELDSRGDAWLPFDRLTPEEKYSVILGKTFDIEHISQDHEARAEDALINKHRAEQGIIIKPNEYLHGFNARDIDGEDGNLTSILNTGFVAGELTGHTAKVSDYDPTVGVPNTDAYPFNLDVWDASAIDGVIQPGNQLNLDAIPQLYGDVSAVIERPDDEIMRQYDPVIPVREGSLPEGAERHGHKLILAGVPSTAIRALMINPIHNIFDLDKEAYEQSRQEQIAEKLAGLKNTLIAEGMYKPIYDDRGELMFTYDEFVSRRQAGDYQVPEVHVPITFDERKRIIEERRKARDKRDLDEEANFVFNFGDGQGQGGV